MENQNELNKPVDSMTAARFRLKFAEYLLDNDLTVRQGLSLLDQAKSELLNCIKEDDGLNDSNKDVRIMDGARYRAVLNERIDHLKATSDAHPEYAVSCANTIMKISEKLFALDRKRY